MQGNKLLTAAIYLAKLRDSGCRDHAYRLRVASKLRNLIDAFIADEVRAATEKNKSDPAYLSWTKVGELLNLSRSAAYTRYKKNAN